jgi:hypothetical protein
VGFVEEIELSEKLERNFFDQQNQDFFVFAEFANPITFGEKAESKASNMVQTKVQSDFI